MNTYSDASARIVARLKEDLPQGILLSGPAGIGLHAAAADIAAVHTKNIVTITPDDKGTISIDTVRELYALGRSKGGMTVFVVDDADAMGREAQNALLKLLEEPVAALRFILTSHVPERLLPTIRSRVAQYSLTPIGMPASTALLDTLKISDATRRAQLLFVAEGLPALLTRYALGNNDFDDRALTVRDAREFLQGSREARLILSARYKDRAAALLLVRDMLKLLRRSTETNPKPDSADALDALLDAEAALEENASVRLSLTNLSLVV